MEATTSGGRDQIVEGEKSFTHSFIPKKLRHLIRGVTTSAVMLSLPVLGDNEKGQEFIDAGKGTLTLEAQKEIGSKLIEGTAQPQVGNVKFVPTPPAEITVKASEKGFKSMIAMDQEELTKHVNAVLADEKTTTKVLETLLSDLRVIHSSNEKLKPELSNSALTLGKIVYNKLNPPPATKENVDKMPTYLPEYAKLKAKLEIEKNKLIDGLKTLMKYGVSGEGTISPDAKESVRIIEEMLVTDGAIPGEKSINEIFINPRPGSGRIAPPDGAKVMKELKTIGYPGYLKAMEGMGKFAERYSKTRQALDGELAKYMPPAQPKNNGGNEKEKVADARPAQGDGEKLPVAADGRVEKPTGPTNKTPLLEIVGVNKANYKAKLVDGKIQMEKDGYVNISKAVDPMIPLTFQIDFKGDGNGLVFKLKTDNNNYKEFGATPTSEGKVTITSEEMQKLIQQSQRNKASTLVLRLDLQNNGGKVEVTEISQVNK